MYNSLCVYTGCTHCSISHRALAVSRASTDRKASQLCGDIGWLTSESPWQQSIQMVWYHNLLLSLSFIFKSLRERMGLDRCRITVRPIMLMYVCLLLLVKVSELSQYVGGAWFYCVTVCSSTHVVCLFVCFCSSPSAQQLLQYLTLFSSSFLILTFLSMNCMACQSAPDPRLSLSLKVMSGSSYNLHLHVV